MNNDDPRTQQATSTPAQYETSQVRPARADADEASALARHGEPSQPKTHTAQQATRQPPRGAVLVRTSELLMQAGGRVAGRGIDLQAELARRTRRLPVQAVAAGRRAVSERARQLPPITAFGHRSAPQPAAFRSGIGLR